jgi:hypothetical protein
MENVNESHDKPPTQMLKLPRLPCKPNWIPPKQTTIYESVKSMVELYKSDTN